MAHFYQMRAPMRDQTETRDAIRELQTFLTRYPTRRSSTKASSICARPRTASTSGTSASA